eukprot:TRINITY_DN34271_c0_g2_i2.p1 TRINITY_DN34271_c0_g2~~TRINITY_DN34271_c0_g2_i2.p1  ORF type:complete len:329 (-),score=-10.39 TRINITY_DN34271_c0_g2_i2:267-1253(-)
MPDTEFVTEKLFHYGGCFVYQSLYQQEPVFVTLNQFKKLHYIPIYSYAQDSRKLEGVINSNSQRYYAVQSNPWINDIKVHLEIVEQVIISSLLGDLQVTTYGALHVRQKWPEYVLFKYQFISQYCTTKNKPYYCEWYNGGSKKWFGRWMVETRSLFKYLRCMFYTKQVNDLKNLQKDIPVFLKNLLISPLALALIIQDDGCKQGKTIAISSQGFKFDKNFESLKLIQDVLYKNFGLRTTLQLAGTIRISQESYRQLDQLIRPFVLPIHTYKLQPLLEDDQQHRDDYNSCSRLCNTNRWSKSESYQYKETHMKDWFRKKDRLMNRVCKP